MYSFKNVSAYIEGKGIIKTNISFEDAIISLSSCLGEVISLPKNALILPAFIDQHTHGAGGYDVMDASIEALKTISKELAKEGTASYLATTTTLSNDNIINALSSVKNYKSIGCDEGAELLGVHLEGPFLSVKYKGAHLEEYIISSNKEIFDKYNEISGGNIKIVTLAIEDENSCELIKYLDDKGIIASIGHSSAKYSDVEKAYNYGAKNVTHTFNAQSPLHHRDVGIVGGVMLIDGLNAELIADLVHVSAPAIKLLIKNKPKDKISLITDAMRAKGLKDGESEICGQKVILKNGEARLEDGTLAGSVLTMNKAVKNVIDLGVSLTDAVDYATKNPAKLLSVFDKKGSIKEGKDADFVVVDQDFNILMTINKGKIIFKA